MNNKIVIFTSQLKRGGGIDSWALLLGNKLMDEGYSPYYLTIYDHGSNNLINGNNYFSINESYNKYNIIKRIFNIFYRAYFLSKVCKDYNIELVISASSVPNLSTILSKLFFNKAKLITTVHNSFFRNSYLERCLIFFQKFSDHIVFVSKETQSIYESIFKTYNNSTIYNSLFSNPHTDKVIQKQFKKQFITIGRLDENKNYYFLLNIFDKYNQLFPNSELIILGDGILGEKLKTYKKKLFSAKNIHFLGIKNDVYKYLKQADYFIMGSKSEGFPMVFLEAMNCGIPIITHDFFTGAKETIRGIESNNLSQCTQLEISNKGILVPYNNESLFLEALLKLDTINFHRKEIINYSKKYFNIDNNIHLWIKLIQKIRS